jgi:ubiquinone biosynthesis protein UbiJ
MTDDADPDELNGPQVLAQFLQDWTKLWREELEAQAGDPEAMASGELARKPGIGSPPDLAAAQELWRTAMSVWAETLGASPASTVRSRDRSIPPRSAAAAIASDPRDAEIERLVRRIDELEARLAKLEAPRRRRG